MGSPAAKVTADHEKYRHSPPWWMVFIYAFPMQVVWMIYLLALWPGLMSPDSVGQWNDALVGPITDVHPAFDTFLIRMIAMIRPTPALIALAQIASLSLVAGCVLVEFESLGVRRWILGLCAGIFAISPVNSLMVNAIWKDIPYSIAFLGLMLLLLKIIVSEGAWLRSAWHILLVGLVAFCVAIFRHNGPPASFGLLLLLPLAFRKYAWQAVAGLAIAIALWLGIRGPVYTWLRVDRSNNFFVYNLELFQIAAHFSYGTRIDEAEANFLANILPLQNFKNYNCHSNGTLLYDPELNHAFAATHRMELHKVFIQISLRQPLVNLKHLLCTSAVIWKVFDDPRYLATIPVYNYDGQLTTIYYAYNQLNVSFSPKLPWLTQPLLTFVADTDDPGWVWLVWRPAIYLYLSILIIIVAAWRSQIHKLWLLLIPIFIHTTILILSIVTPDFRFQYPIYIFTLLFWLLLLLKPVNQKD
jgi:hypothetical protein